MKNNNSILEKMYNVINTHKRFSIFMHENPDLDTIWSGLALWKVLEKLWKEVYYFSPWPISEKYKFVPYIDDIKTDIQFYPQDTDINIFVDMWSVLKQLSDWPQKVDFSKYINVIIDHHKTFDNFWDIVYRKVCGSTSMLVYNFLEKFYKEFLDKNIVKLLYYGHITDTNFCKRSENYEDFYIWYNLFVKGGENKQLLENILQYRLWCF